MKDFLGRIIEINLLKQNKVKRQEIESTFIIFNKMVWHMTQIGRQTMEDNPTIIKGYTLIFQNKEATAFKFRCKCQREKKLDRLMCYFIDQVGNFLYFDELTTKQIIFRIKKDLEQNPQNPQDIIIQFHEGIIKFIMKQRIQQTVNLPENILDDPLFSKRIQKLKLFLNQRIPIFNKLSILLNLKTFGHVPLDREREKRLKSLELKLIKNVKKILSSPQTELQQLTNLVISKKEKNQRQNQFLKKQRPTGTGTGIGDLEKSNLHFLEQLQEQFQQVQKTHKGGSSIVQRRKINQMTFINAFDENGRTRQTLHYRTLALKIPKDQEYFYRFERELMIINQMNKEGGKKEFLLNYYKFKKHQEKNEEDIEERKKSHSIYIEYCDLNLNEFLSYYREFLTMKEILSICKQILMILIDIHKNKIVYRDLKPSNIMVSYQGKNIVLKLIDFSDSFYENQSKKSQKLCGTLPYSPIETSRFFPTHQQEGIKNKEIDYWSAGIIIHEIFYGVFPINYSAGLARDILSLWSLEFNYSVKNYKNKGLKLIDTVFQLIKLNLVRVNQKERTIPAKIHVIMQLIELFYDNMEKQIIQ